MGPASDASCGSEQASVSTLSPDYNCLSSADHIIIRSRPTGHSFHILHATKAESSGTVIAWRHQQKLAVLIIAIGLREVPDRTLRLIMASSAEYASARVVIDVLIGPLPDVPHHIDDAKWACPGWIRIDLIGRG